MDVSSKNSCQHLQPSDIFGKNVTSRLDQKICHLWIAYNGCPHQWCPAVPWMIRWLKGNCISVCSGTGMASSIKNLGTMNIYIYIIIYRYKYIFICANVKKYRYLYIYTVVYAYYTNHYFWQEMAMGFHPKNKRVAHLTACGQYMYSTCSNPWCMFLTIDTSLFSSYKKLLEIQRKCSLHAPRWFKFSSKWSVYDINILGFCMIPEDVHSIHDNGSTKYNGNLI